jgi:hypothetical protein
MSGPNVVSQIKSDLNSWERRRAKGGGPETRRRLSRDIKNWASLAAADLQQQVKMIVAEFRRLSEIWSGLALADPVLVRPLYYQVASARHYRFGGWAAVTLEALFAAFLTAHYTNAPAWLSALAGAVVAILVAILFKGGLAPFLAQAEKYPVQSGRRIRVALWATSGLEVVLLLIVFLVRNSSEGLASMIGWMFGPALSLLSLVTPLCAAVLFSGYVLLGWSLRKTEELDEIQELLRDIHVLCYACDDSDFPSSDAVDPTTKRPPAPDGKPPKEPVGRFIAALILAALLLGGHSRAQEPIGLLFVDKTTSVDDQARSYALALVQQRIPEITLQTHVSQWQFFLFDSDPWQMAPVYWFPVPSMDRIECTSAPGDADWFTGPREARRKANEAKCKEKTSAQLANFQQQVGQKLERTQQLLVVRDPTKAGCTAFWDAIRRIAASPGPTVALVISDAVDSCRKISEPIAPPLQDVRLVVVLVPSRAEWRPGLTAAEQFQRRASEVKRFAPWVRSVVPPWGCAADAFGSVPSATPSTVSLTKR